MFAGGTFTNLLNFIFIILKSVLLVLHSLHVYVVFTKCSLDLDLDLVLFNFISVTLNVTLVLPYVYL